MALTPTHRRIYLKRVTEREEEKYRLMCGCQGRDFVGPWGVTLVDEGKN